MWVPHPSILLGAAGTVNGQVALLVWLYLLTSMGVLNIAKQECHIFHKNIALTVASLFWLIKEKGSPLLCP